MKHKYCEVLQFFRFFCNVPSANKRLNDEKVYKHYLTIQPIKNHEIFERCVAQLL